MKIDLTDNESEFLKKDLEKKVKKALPIFRFISVIVNKAGAFTARIKIIMTLLEKLRGGNQK